MEKDRIINLAVIVSILAAATIFTYLAFNIRETPEPPNVFACSNQKAIFRANISDCNAVNITPNDKILAETLTDPRAIQVLILVNPYDPAGVGTSAYEIFKTYKSLEPRTGISSGVVYTKHNPEQPNIPNLSLTDASFKYPIIWLRLNQTETHIEVNGPMITVNAKNQYGLDSASCKIAILVIKQILSC